MSRTWNVAVHLFDADDVDPDGTRTTAHAVLTTTAGTTIEGHGLARRNPHDAGVREIGEELAAARALRDVADRLLQASEDDITAVEERTAVEGRSMDLRG